MEATQRKPTPTTSFGKRTGADASFARPSSKPCSTSHLARSPSTLPHSALVRVDPMWPCFGCRASRAKCEGGFPCSRCARLSSCCLPNSWKSEDPILEYVLTTNSPKPFAEMYAQSFEKLYLAGNIRRESAVRVLKMWNFLSCLAGADVTLGVAEHVRERFDISPLEMDEPMRMLQDPPLHVRQQRLRYFQASEAKQARTQQLKETEIYKRENEGAEALNAAVLMFVTTESTMWAACNDVHTSRLQGATELWDKALQRKMIWAYLMAPIYATEDRQQLFDLLAQMVFGHSSIKLTMLVRMYANDGTSNLYLSSVRTMRLGPQTTGLIFKTEVAPPSRHLTTPMGQTRVTSRVRTSRPNVVGRGKEEGGWPPEEGQFKWEEGSVVSDTEGRIGGQDGFLTGGIDGSGEGSEAVVGRRSSSVSNIAQDNKIPNLPVAGLAAFPFGADGAALPPAPSPDTRRSTSKTGPNPRSGVSNKTMAAAAMAGLPRAGEIPICSSSLVARAAAMSKAELEALFAKKAGGRRRIAVGRALGRVKGQETGRGAEEQQGDGQHTGREGGAKVEPPSASQIQSAGDEQQHHYQQHQYDGHPPQHHQQAQEHLYTQSQQRVASEHLAHQQQRLSFRPVASLSSPFALPSREDDQLALSHAHYHFQQQQAMRAVPYGQQQDLHQEDEAVLTPTEAGWRDEVFAVHRSPLPPLSPVPLLDEGMLQEVFAEEEREGQDKEVTEEEEEDGFDYGLGEEEEEGEEDKAEVEEERNPPLPVSHMDRAGYPSTSIRQHRRHEKHLQQHQQYQQDYHHLQQHQIPPPPQHQHHFPHQQQRPQPTFMENDKEVMDLFKDGDIESW